jgi:peptidoglycan/LPS O-acetylase OafA/YrhL
MGSYRLLLAVMVVAFHFGGWSPLTGRTAVFGFYCLSGYLMLLVLDRVYAHKPRGPLRFYANRFLRIYPVYLFYLVAMAIAIAIRGSADFVVDAGAAPFHLVPAATAHFGVVDYLRELAFGNGSPSAPIRASDPSLVPQGWSLGIEMMFYVMAPALLLLGRRWYAWAALACAFVAYIAGTMALDLSLDHYRYKSFLGSAIVFLYGAALYRFRDRLPRLPRPELLSIGAAILWLILIQKVSGPATDA